MAYFQRFGLLAYDVAGNGTYKLLPNILKRVKLRANVKGGALLFDSYDVQDNEKPEDIAFKYYGDAEYHWVVLITNNITDRYYQWPMPESIFNSYITDKYGSGNEEAVHHYEVDQSSGSTTSAGPSDYSHRVEVNSDHDNPYIITNREYEQRVQDKNRKIKLLDRRYLKTFVSEFNSLIKD
jgi:hypothetical protein|tara:strand:- start:446 stop:988 length:543 start_codon:yes stop_codon:yes gene_type:complete